MKRRVSRSTTWMMAVLTLLGALSVIGCQPERPTTPTAEGDRMPADVQAEMQRRMGGVSGPSKSTAPEGDKKTSAPSSGTATPAGAGR